jgi:photosystem II stability/assembly factor-like uncharacterized protein
MAPNSAGAAARPDSVEGATARSAGPSGRHHLVLALTAVAALVTARAAPSVAADAPAASVGENTDTPIWRASHGLLLGIARAGTRFVAVGNGGAVLLSDDEGKTWRAAKTPTDELLAAVVFPTAREGWIVGQDELILHSTDAGETWTQQYIKADADQTLFTIASIAPNHLFASGAYDLILETMDGATWKESKIDNLDDDYHLNCAVARGNDVLVTGESGHAFIRYAGAWTPMKMDYDGSQFACLVGADGTFYSFGLRGSAFKAAPGAAKWTRIDLATQASIFGAANLADGRMALVGSNGSIRLLDPASGRVTTLPQVSEKALSAVVEGRDGKLIVVGADGVHVVDTAGAAAAAGVGQ